MKVKGLTLSKSDVSQTINLEELLGVSFRGKKDLRLAIAQAVIDAIVERTEKGKDISGNEFAKYSKDYKASTTFKLLKDSTKPNMTLTGAMLASIDVLGDGPNTIRIGYRDNEETLKAFNHNTGDTVPARKFFGMTQKQVKELISSEFKDEIASLKGRDPERQTVADILARGFVASDTNAANQLLLTFNTLEDFDAGG